MPCPLRARLKNVPVLLAPQQLSYGRLSDFQAHSLTARNLDLQRATPFTQFSGRVGKYL